MHAERKMIRNFTKQLSSITLPFLLLSFVAAPVAGALSRAETIAAAVLVPCAVFIIWNETLANWQALWFTAGLLALALTLLRARNESRPAS